MDEFASCHPFQLEEYVQGCLEVMWQLGEFLKEITGLEGITLAPAAGAHGELTAMMMIRRYHEERGSPRSLVLVPDTAHGTNPSSAHVCGYRVKEVPSGERGYMEPSSLKESVSDEVAALMLTNPNTLGIFEENILELSEILHEAGALLYCDGANMNALVGISKPGSMGVDAVHLNLHKTFSTPHGGGGPGAGPVAVSGKLEPYLPVPVVKREGDVFTLDEERPLSIGRIRAFQGHFSVNLKALTYILAVGSDGFRKVAEAAVLNANYVKSRLREYYDLPYGKGILHEVVFSHARQKRNGVTAFDIAKRLIDLGFHPPTIFFPLIIDGALMIEPTETESKEELDRFIDAMIAIAREAEENPSLLHDAPQDTPVKRLDEVRAARKPVLRWRGNPHSRRNED